MVYSQAWTRSCTEYSKFVTFVSVVKVKKAMSCLRLKSLSDVGSARVMMVVRRREKVDGPGWRRVVELS